MAQATNVNVSTLATVELSWFKTQKYSSARLKDEQDAGTAFICDGLLMHVVQAAGGVRGDMVLNPKRIVQPL